MSESRDELRDHLVAAMEASPELQPEDRHHLADVFMDRLNTEYDLVPRSARARRQPNASLSADPLTSALRRWWPVLLIGFGALFVALSVSWSTAGAFGYGHHTFAHHPFGFLPFLFVLFILFRVLGPRRYRGRRSRML